MAVSQTLAHLADPLRDFRYNVVIQPNDRTQKAINMGFMTVSGLGFTTDVIPYRQGGWNVSVTNMPGQVLFNPFTLVRGVTVGATQLQISWFLEIFGLIQGAGGAGTSGAANQPGGITATSDFRATVYIYVLDHPNTTGTEVEKAGIKVYNCWPYQMAYSDLDAGSNQLLISQMTLANEGFDSVVAGSATGAAIPAM